MCEFELPDGSTLGIMPNTSIEKLFGKNFEKQKRRKTLPQTEFYFVVDDALHFHKRALQFGTSEIKEFAEMDWGHKAVYNINHDGHILAFAEMIKK